MCLFVVQRALMSTSPQFDFTSRGHKGQLCGGRMTNLTGFRGRQLRRDMATACEVTPGPAVTPFRQGSGSSALLREP